jgi:hypothetical protein
MFKSATEVERAERDQHADCARIDAALDSAKKNIAAVESLQLDPNEIRKQWSAIRDRTILGIRNVRHNVVRRAAAAKETEIWMVVKFLREVRDGRVLREFTADLKEVPTKNLLDHLRYLIQIGDVARIQSLGAVFATRNDRRPYSATFGKMLTEFTLAQSGSMGERIPKIYLLAETADARLVDVFYACGRTRLRAPTSQPLLEPPRIDGWASKPFPATRSGMSYLKSLSASASHSAIAREAHGAGGARGALSWVARGP